jgi:hypothetical protein
MPDRGTHQRRVREGSAGRAARWRCRWPTLSALSRRQGGGDPAAARTVAGADAAGLPPRMAARPRTP